jgi:hypothetical protein
MLLVQNTQIQEKLAVNTQIQEEVMSMKNNGQEGNNINYIDLLIVKKKKQDK